ncbi:hypothetical protein K504DRAFT_408028 [Pleomassaria siparia CBS 279.74]|uniref:Ubiquitin-like protein smt3 n=1 Tax=Pleomassaria siparia CBS 279.74 TaxID=1314801 RepID=A0A6G1K7H3_9PLEO|nr:hypothetical protein K504DRAFT_408028 [Pleomassaria siparia CBS 279.74]
MAHATPSEAEVANTLSNLHLSTSQTVKAKAKSALVADSWDEEGSSGSETETETKTTLSTVPTSTSAAKDSLGPIKTSASYQSPNAPPPTPASPTPFKVPDSLTDTAWFNQTRGIEGGREGSGTNTPTKRPEKTTAVAGRLIAAGLGVRPPRRTEEERAYDKATREKVRKQRDEEREKEKREKEQAEARKKAVWDD